MRIKSQILGFVIVCLIGGNVLGAPHSSKYVPRTENQDDLKILNESLMGNLVKGDLQSSKSLTDRIIKEMNSPGAEDDTRAESNYLISVYYSKIQDYKDAIRYMNTCISLKEKHKLTDVRYFKALYNLSIFYYNTGDFINFEKSALRSLEIGKAVYGQSSAELMNSYTLLTSAYIEQKEYEKAINNSNVILGIALANPGFAEPNKLAALYYNLGVCCNRVADFSKAKLYFDKTESIYSEFKLEKNDDYINLMNALAVTYNSLGITDESVRYYERGISLAVTRNSPLSYNIINSYGIFLASTHKPEKGASLLKSALGRAEKSSKTEPHAYFEVLNNYANFLRDYIADGHNSIKYYEECVAYLKKNKEDIALREAVYLGYSRALEISGQPEKALEIIQSLIDSITGESDSNTESDGSENLIPDKTSLKILKARYDILWDIYRKNGNLKFVEKASHTAELIIRVIDKVRINISEEESRLILGDRYRSSYTNAIRDFSLLYDKTSREDYMEKAFEYSEKSKVAGLLTSTRELKAVQFNIPAGIADYERDLQKDISLLNVRIAEATAKGDLSSIPVLKETLLNYTRKRDSLILVFEKQYPEYYSIKYNSHIAGSKDIPSIIGRNGNYVNYVLSDSIIYIFLVNRKYMKIFTARIDSTFYRDIKKFRELLAVPSSTEDEYGKFEEFQNTGNKLYRTLIEPVRQYLISDKLVISPDNLLSYLPFETFPVSVIYTDDIRYNKLRYLMSDLDISYAYSATFLAETEKKGSEASNELIAFAPDYPEPINIQTILLSRQAEQGVLSDLPFAREEASAVSKMTGGRLYENSDARESVFKNESGKYDIIHLAMHTLLNDKDPMRSTLIFSHARDTSDDGLLKTYEIYGIPLKAKMVVLSSCNTGTGTLSSGEGILSLARGFVYSGSQSVVMSMWEIEDKSGTEIVKSFYRNLKKGESKSIALKNARMTFLKNSDRLRSHPYFWSALVIYGNDEPLYKSSWLRITIMLFSIIVVASGYYFWKRRYS